MQKHTTVVDVQEYHGITALCAYVNENDYLIWDELENGKEQAYYNDREIEVGNNELRLYYEKAKGEWTCQWLCDHYSSSHTTELTTIPFISGLSDEELFQLETVWDYEVSIEYVKYFQDFLMNTEFEHQTIELELDFNLLSSWMR